MGSVPDEIDDSDGKTLWYIWIFSSYLPGAIYFPCYLRNLLWISAGKYTYLRSPISDPYTCLISDTYESLILAEVVFIAEVAKKPLQS